MLITRLFNFTPGTPAVAGQVNAEFDQVLSLLNGQVDSSNVANGSLTADDLQTAIQQALGLNATGVKRRGKSIISGTDTRADASFGLMGTPDVVTSLVVPADGLVLVSYQAQWKDSIASVGRAAIFVGANQLKVQSALGGANGPVIEAATIGGSDTLGWEPLFSVPWGLASSAAGGDFLSDVSTGQALSFVGGVYGLDANLVTTTVFGPAGGFCIIDGLAAGTYDISVQFRATSGQVQARQRRLRAWVLGF